MIPIWKLKSIKEAASRNEFYNLMTVGLKSLLFNAYRNTPTTYQNLVNFDTSIKDKEGYPALGSSGLPKKVLAGQPYQEIDIPPEDTVEITNYKFGRLIAIHQELFDDDQTGQIKKFPKDSGKAHAKFEDKSVYSVITSNATAYDSQNLFSLNHPGYTGGAAIGVNDNIYTNVTLSANALAVALGMMAQWTGHTSEDILDVTATTVLVPENLKHTARVLVDSQWIPLAYAAGVYGPATTGGGGSPAKNVIKDLALKVVSSPRLDSASSTDWYLWSDFPGLVFQWREKLKVLEENESSGVRFERDVMRWKSKVRFGLKAINWRLGMLIS